MSEQANITLDIPHGVDMVDLVGPGSKIAHLIEDSFDASVTLRGERITISGNAAEVDALAKLFSDLIDHVLAGHPSDIHAVRSAIGHIKGEGRYENPFNNDVVLTAHGRSVRPKTLGQKRYVDAIRANTITFGVGPAGTGKTYLAMACAIAALRNKEVRRLVFTRPVVEAGENLGFLPGTLEEKIDPYIRPLFDALYDMMEREQADELLESGVIEVAPLAFMRGRTFNDSFLILDEAQNTTPGQMKLFLTRLGFRSKMVVTGDDTQLDLPRGVSGLKGIQDILGEVDDIAFCRFGEVDVVRNSLVAKIVEAYAKAEL
ncbi:MAG: PhoH family protein [Coriobacteriia bacterium]|nr:PhoH family protein [Coriobacteriia bacterium]